MSAPETPATPGQAAEIPAAFGGWVRMQFPREIELPKNEIAGRWKYMTGPAEREFWREVETALAGRQPQPAPDSRRALLDIIDVVEHLDEPGPEADYIRLLAEYGLGEAAHPDDDGPYHVEADTTPPHAPLTARDLEGDARDMAAEDGDHDHCEPTL